MPDTKAPKNCLATHPEIQAANQFHGRSLTKTILLRSIYISTGIGIILLLSMGFIYMSAQKMPGFYYEAISVSPDVEKERYDSMLKKTIRLNNALQNPQKPWSAMFTAADINSYLAVEIPKQGSNLLPEYILQPRISFSHRQVEIACRIYQDGISMGVYLVLGLTIPEPSRLQIRIKEARIGLIPIGREFFAPLLKDALKSNGFEVSESTEAGDPVLSMPLTLVYAKDFIIEVDGLEIEKEGIRFDGTAKKRNEKH
ncbi:MAG: hypothetical protein ACRCUY_08335 [Thermoguttaceae bacterium]